MLKTLTSALVALALSATAALAIDQRISPYGAAVVADMQSTLNYQSTWGITERHDEVFLSGSGSADLEGGFISLESGTTGGSSSKIETVEFGRYTPGRRAVAGIGIIPETLPTGDGFIRYGTYTDTNGVFVTQYADDLCITYQSPNQSPNEVETCQLDFNGNPQPDDFDPAVDGHIMVVLINWYGIGGAEVLMLYATENGIETWLLHYYAPPTGQAMEDPNLPIVAEADNGTTAENVEVQFGGRRYDIEGDRLAEGRTSGEYQYQQLIEDANGIEPIICLRRKSEFPPGSGRTNTVSISLRNIFLETDTDIVGWVFIDPDLSGATFGTPSQQVNDETAIESSTDATSFTSPEALTEPFLIPASGGTGSNAFGNVKEVVEVEFPGTDPVCLGAQSLDGTDATVSAVMTVTEIW